MAHYAFDISIVLTGDDLIRRKHSAPLNDHIELDHDSPSRIKNLSLLLNVQSAHRVSRP